MRKILISFFLLSLAAFAGRGQTPSNTPKRDTLTVTTNLIQIDVTVTDNKGKIIRDLKPEEFEILENDKKQEISNFSFISSVDPESAKKAAAQNPSIPVPPSVLRPENIRRTIAIVVDDISLSFESTAFVRGSLKKFITEQMIDGDLIAIIRTSGGIGALQQFTSDRRQLLAAIERIRWNRLTGGGVGTFDPIQGKIDNIYIPAEQQSPGQRGSAADQLGTDNLNLENDADRRKMFASGTLGAINYVMRGMLTLPGRKSIMLLSDGLKLISRDASGSIDTSNILPALRKLVEDANKASVVVYTMDARGLDPMMFTAADSPNTLSSSGSQGLLSTRRTDFKESQDGLVFLAKETGGIPILNNNDPAAGIRKMLDDQSYYLLGFILDDTGDVQQHRSNKLTVRVKREGTNVRYRSAFFGLKDGPSGVPFTVTRYDQIYEALSSPFAVNGITMRLNTLYGYNEKDRSFMRSFLYVDAKDLNFVREADGFHKAVVRIMAVSYGETGLPVDKQDITATLKVPDHQFARIIEAGYLYGFSFPVKKPGAYQMRVAIRDEVNGKVGSANQYIEAPDLNKTPFSLSGIVIESVRPQSANAARSNNDEQKFAAMGDTALRRFHRGAVLNYGIELYKGKSQKDLTGVQLHIRVYRNGALLLTGQARPLDLTDPKRPTFDGALSIGDRMEPGDYILQIVASDGDAARSKKIATQFVQFEVVE